MSKTMHQRILGGIDELIDPTGPEARRQEDVAIGWNDRVLQRLGLSPAAGLHAGKSPLVWRDHLWCIVGVTPPRQHRQMRIERDRGVRLCGDPATERKTC